MILRFDDIEPIGTESPREGRGFIENYPYTILQGLGGKIKMFNMATLHEASAIGYHTHTDDMEVYILLDGKGKYSDNGTETEVNVGDVMVCKKGESHSLEALGGETLTFIAFIME